MKKSILTLGVAVVAGLAITGGYYATRSQAPRPLPDDLPEMISLGSGSVQHRPAGDFRVGNHEVDAPLEEVAMAENLEIMRFPVTEADYAICVEAGACTVSVSSGSASLPQTHVNYTDAQDFAAWQSARTGQVWRLPTDPEWAFAAAERYVDDALETDLESNDPAQRWLQSYKKNAYWSTVKDPDLHAFGTYGENSRGVSYVGSNVWEWTTTCFKKAKLNTEGHYTKKAGDYCGVRLAAGLHRAFIIDFVRDARVGGCAVGLPPDYLGFRLVREG